MYFCLSFEYAGHKSKKLKLVNNIAPHKAVFLFMVLLIIDTNIHRVRSLVFLN